MLIQSLFGTQYFVTDVAFVLISSYLIMHFLDVPNQVVSNAECLVALHAEKVFFFPVNTFFMIN